MSSKILKCFYPECTFRTLNSWGLKRHVDSTMKKHCHDGFLFKMQCSVCNEILYTKAFSLDQVQLFLAPGKRQPAVCVMCQENEPAKKKRKKTRTPRETINKMISVFEHPNMDPDAFRGVDLQDVKTYFANMSDEDKDACDLTSVFVSNSVLGLVQLYTQDPKGGGGSDIHPAIREFWHTYLFRGRFYEVAHEKGLNSIRTMFLLYTSMYSKEKGAPLKPDVFAEQSYKIRKLGKPIINKCGAKFYTVAEGIFSD